MIIGYARVSTHEQTLDLQLDALHKAGCDTDKTYKDKISSRKADRLGRSLQELITLVHTIHAKGAGFKSLTESMDTTTSGGKLIFHFFGALAEFEREVIKERTIAGLQAARARGRLGGRPTIQSRDPKKIALARQLYDDRHMTVQEICDTLHIGRATLYRYVVDKTAKVGVRRER